MSTSTKVIRDALRPFLNAANLVKIGRDGSIRWTPQIIAVLCDMGLAGATPIEAANLFGISKRAVVHACYRHGIKLNTRPPLTFGNGDSTIDATRSLSGAGSLPAGHLTTWAAIMAHTPSIADMEFERQPRFFSGR